MGHESRIEPWSPHWTAFCFAGFGTDRLRCEEAMKTAGRENPKRWAHVPSNRALGAGGQNRSCSITWAAKQEKFQPKGKCFFLTSTFIELTRTYPRSGFCARCEQYFCFSNVVQLTTTVSGSDSSEGAKLATTDFLPSQVTS
jgi:hypothetical protein